jgi:hypothetical protein
MNQSANADFYETFKKKLEAKAALNVNTAQGITGLADLVYAFAQDKNHVYHCGLLERSSSHPTRNS